MAMPPTIQFASLGMADSLILMVLALVVFGPRRLPQIGRQIGKLMYEFRKASNDFKFQMEEELRNSEDAERRKKEEDRLRAMALEAPVQAVPAVTGETSEVSQVPESGPGAPSPYSEEGLYPEMNAEVTVAEPEETVPRIQPPTTGEQVAADPSNRQAAQVGVSAEAEAGPVQAETAGRPRAKRTRKAKQNQPPASEAAEESKAEPAAPATEHVNQNG
jgi:sec-independent protein translocase protein TatB